MKKLIVLLVILAVAGGGGYAYYRDLENEKPKDGTLVLYGNVDIREADLAFNISGRVETMQVEEGVTVQKGQLMATLDAATYQAEVDVAQARVNAQKAALNRLLAGSRSEEIKKARADVAALEADLRDARATLARTEQLAQQSFASQQKLSGDRARVESLQAHINAAQQALSLAIQGPRNEDIAQAQAQLKAEEATLTLARQYLAYTRLHAPEAGIVKTRIVEPGAVVQPQTPVYTLALSDPVWVRTYVSETDLGKVFPGMKAEIVTDSAPERPREGWVGFISPVAEFTPKSVETPDIRTGLVYRLRVYVKNADNGLRQGMPATVRLKPGAGGEERQSGS